MNATWAALQRVLFGEPLWSADKLEATVQATWPLSPGVAALILVVSAAIVVATYWHERRSAARHTKMLLAGIRTMLMLIVVLMLYGWTVQRHRTDRPDVVVVLDDSASMGLVDFSDPALVSELTRRFDKLELGTPTRLNLAKALLLAHDGELLKSLQQRYHLRLFLASSSRNGAPPLFSNAALTTSSRRRYLY